MEATSTPAQDTPYPPSRAQVRATLAAALVALQRGAALFTPAPTVTAAPTGPQTASQGQHGPTLRGTAACPRCGRVRGVVYDGASHRCYQCWHCWVPAPAPSVA